MVLYICVMVLDYVRIASRKLWLKGVVVLQLVFVNKVCNVESRCILLAVLDFYVLLLDVKEDDFS